MFLSMTGFGSLDLEISKEKKITIKIKTLNSKIFDSVIEGVKDVQKIHQIRDKLKGLVRGRVFLSIASNDKKGEGQIPIKELKQYMNELKELVKGQKDIEYLNIATRFLKNNNGLIYDDKDWQIIEDGIDKVIKEVFKFRQVEGNSIKGFILKTISKVERHILKIESYDKQRRKLIKININKKIIALSKVADNNTTQIEQESTSILDKTDISEEKVRLKNHLKFFLSTLKNKSITKGDKLSFIITEMGRELNTMSAKSSYFKIQKTVIEIKELLNGVKEQLANVL